MFADHGIECLGAPCAIVAVPVGADAVGRVASSLLLERGVLANLVEFPAVPVDASWFRMQAMAVHTREHAQVAARVVAECIEEARSRTDARAGEAR